MKLDKQFRLDTLKDELAAAGLQVSGLVSRIDDDGTDVYALDGEGRWVELAETARPVLEAHDGTPPVPVDFGPNAVDLVDAQRVRAYVTASNAYITRGNTNTAAHVRDQVDRNTQAILTLIKLVRGTNG
jgi:hypothetical protein